MITLNMKQRFYFDTSVFGGIFDAEFEEETTLLFEKVRLGQIKCVYSNLTESELTNAPSRVTDFFETIPNQFKEKVFVTPDSLILAQTYVDEKVVGESSMDDCLHIATATIHKVDMLVSWNFKHIVNVYRIRGYNSINLRLGYGTLDIHSPKEIVNDDNEQ
jgi:predicted nucleic acid-binding protein